MRLDRPTISTTQSKGFLTAFQSSLVFKDVSFRGETAKNKKEAEQLAACAAILSLLESEDGFIISMMIKDKVKHYSLSNEVKVSDNIQNESVGVKTNQEYNMPISAMPEGQPTSMPPPIPPSFHKFRKPTTEAPPSPSVSITPIEASEQPMLFPSVPVKKRNRKNNKKAKKVRVDNHIQMWAHQQPPPQPQPQPQQYAAPPAAALQMSGPDEIRTLRIGDLQYWMDEAYITNSFYPRGELVSVEIIRNKQTGQPKGYGFLEFISRAVAEKFLQTYNGMPMPLAQQSFSLNWASLSSYERRAADGGQQYRNASYQSSQESQGESDPSNTTIFVSALHPSVSEDALRHVFGRFGELVHVKIPMGKRCGFVQFATRACAEQALSFLNGTPLGGQNIRLSWGRSPSIKLAQPDLAQWNGAGGYYEYAQGCEAYGYAPPPQDPNACYRSYPGYGNY